MKITAGVLVVAFLVAVGLAVGFWSWDVLHTFHVPDPWTTLPQVLPRTFREPALRPIALWALVKAVVPVAIVLWLLGQFDDSDHKPRVVAGVEVVEASTLRDKTCENPWQLAWDDIAALFGRPRSKQLQVTVAGVAIPRAIEAQHFLTVGRPGAGKSTAMDEMLAGALERGDRLIVIDPNAHALERFWRDGDVVLNPFDKRSPGWNPFKEVGATYDFDWLAKSIVPDASNAASQEWHGYAQMLLAETMRAMLGAGDRDLMRLVMSLTQVSAEKLEAMVAATAAAGQFTQGAEKALASTRFILARHLAPFQYLRPAEFSLRDWLQERTGNLYITWREDQLQSLKPLVSAWVDILIASVLTLPADKSTRPLWLFLDELASLEKLTSLEAGLTKGRKHGLRIVAGLQSSAQLEAVYGVHHAPTIRGCFGSLLAFGCSSADPATAELMAKGLGQQEIEQVTVTRGANGKSTSTQRRTRLAVLPSELTALNSLRGYLKFAGNYPVGRVRLTRRQYAVRTKGFKLC